jgi:repressor LexA
MRHGVYPNLFQFADDAFGITHHNLFDYIDELYDRDDYIEEWKRGNAEQPPTLRLPLKAYGIPVLGFVPAGPLNDVEENTIVHLDFPRRDKFFALQVEGNSMEDIIQDGDIVLISRDKELKYSSQICVINIDGKGATLKYVEKLEPDVFQVRAHNSNSDFKTQIFEHGNIARIEIKGIYQGLWRGNEVQDPLKRQKWSDYR